jgi:hypothetical protein
MARNRSISQNVEVALNEGNPSSEEENEPPEGHHNSQETIDAIFDALQLKEQEIRLVILGPAPSADAPPVCRLKVFKLAARPVFEALSWAWGDPTFTRPMTLQGRTWHGPANLVSALQCLRLPNKSRTLWVDALCINQSAEIAALKERGHQVQLMKYVYSMASHVIIWMGVPEGDLAEFLVMYAFQNQSLQDAARHDINLTIEKLLQILGLPWWQRLWVLQECALASMASMYFGCEAVEFRHFVHDIWFTQLYLKDNAHRARDYVALKRLLELDIATSYLEENEHFDTLAAYYRQRIDNGTQTRHSGGPTTQPAVEIKSAHRFAGLLARGRYRLTSDPRDKIYALLGLADDVMADELYPRYDEAADRTFIRTAEKLLTTQRSLYVLSQASRQNSPGLEGLPSWVPDWSVPPEPRGHWISGVLLREMAEEEFKACSDVIPMLTVLSNNTLKVKGIWLGTIAAPTFEAEEHEKYRELVRLMVPYGPPRDIMLSELDRTTAIEKGACLFRTQDGGMGTCRTNVKGGESIFVLAGGRVPFVLRPSRPGHHKLVGECHIPGLMMGEATKSGYDSIRRRQLKQAVKASSVFSAILRKRPERFYDNWKDIYLE